MEGSSKIKGIGKGYKDTQGDDFITDEQRNLEQEALFDEARKQYEQQQQMQAASRTPELSNQQMGCVDPNSPNAGGFQELMI